MSRIGSGIMKMNAEEELQEKIDKMIVDKAKSSEFGFCQFLNPFIQASFERAQEEYKRKYVLKKSYDNQEFLRRMRTDIKREYLTRKKQLKKLQTEAAVAFREAERRLQEHYSTEFAASQGTRVIDITLPLVHDISLPNDSVFDLNHFNVENAFREVLHLHNQYYQNEKEGAIEFMRQKEMEEHLVQQYHQQEQEQEQTYRDDDYDFDSDSEYCDVFSHYPSEYELERQMREDEEARVAQAARLRAEHQAEAAAEEARRRSFWYELSPEEEQRLWFENTHGVNDAWSVDQDDDDNNDNDQEPACDDIPLVEPKERHPSNAAAVAATSINVISAKKKAVSKSNAAAAAKARIAKQQQKKQEKKFAPLQIMINDNRERHANNQDQEATAILSASKLEINLPKKNLQGASRDAIKRHNQKWNRVNALAKQSGARGTRIANLPTTSKWWARCGGDDSD